MALNRVVSTENKKPRRPYAAPQVKTGETAVPPVFLACTGRFDCEGIVGYPCCAADDQCIGC